MIQGKHATMKTTQNLSATFSMALAALMVMCSPAAWADVYGFVEGARVLVIISDTPPADPRYILFKKGSVDPSNAIPDEPSGAGRSETTKYRGHILAAARATKVDPALIRAVISVESGYNPSARSSAGAVGLMQLTPETARRYGVKDRLDPAQNINGGARYLRDLKVMFDGDLKLVLAAYNAGAEAVMRYGRHIPPFRETEAYVPKVLNHYRQFRYRDAIRAGRMKIQRALAHGRWRSNGLQSSKRCVNPPGVEMNCKAAISAVIALTMVTGPIAFAQGNGDRDEHRGNQGNSNQHERSGNEGRQPQRHVAVAAAARQPRLRTRARARAQ